MPKEIYLTDKNQALKVRKWKKALSPFSEKWKTLEPMKSALLVIDMQNYFLHPGSHAAVPSRDLLKSNVQDLIDHFHRIDRPVYFTTFAVRPEEADPILKWWGDSVKFGSPESRLAQPFELVSGDFMIRKPTYSCFFETSLESTLKNQGVRDVVICGVLTNLCCDMAAREAFVRGFNAFITIDGTAAYSEEMHLSSLKNLAYGFATPLSVQDITK